NASASSQADLCSSPSAHLSNWQADQLRQLTTDVALHSFGLGEPHQDLSEITLSTNLAEDIAAEETDLGESLFNMGLNTRGNGYGEEEVDLPNPIWAKRHHLNNLPLQQQHQTNMSMLPSGPGPPGPDYVPTGLVNIPTINSRDWLILESRERRYAAELLLMFGLFAGVSLFVLFFTVFSSSVRQETVE
ncbi:unnamed protein product, partial [Protopolystoma xenopodis]